MDVTLFNQHITQKKIKSTGNSLALIEQRASMLEQQEIIAKLSPNEYSIALAGTKKPIRIMDDEELLKTVVISAKWICKDIGIQHWDDAERMKHDSIRFLDILKLYYSDLTISEVKMAFELAAVGMLDDFLPIDRHGKPDKHHYQSFSMEYYTKILNAFRQKKSGVWTKVKNALPVHEAIVTEEQKQKIYQHFINDIYDAYIAYQKGVHPNFVMSIYIKELQTRGYIQELPIPTDDDLRKAYHAILTSEIPKDDKKRIKERYQKGDYSGSVQQDAETKIYNLAIAKVFDQWIKQGFDLIPKEQ